MKIVGKTEVTALSSWTVFGSVLLFVDDLEGTTSALNAFDEEIRHKIRLAPSHDASSTTPDRPPHLDYIINQADVLVDTPLVAFINSDIIVSKSFHHIPLSELIHHDLILSSGRMECRGTIPQSSTTPPPPRIMFAEDMDELDPPCEYAKGKDLFVYPRGFFKRRNFIVPPFVLARPMWDNWIADVSHHNLVDASPMFLVAHLYHGEQWMQRDPKTGLSPLASMDPKKAYEVKLNHHLTRVCCEPTIDVLSVCPYIPSPTTGHGSFACTCKKRPDCLNHFILVKASHALCADANGRWRIHARTADFRTSFEDMIYKLEQHHKLLRQVRQSGEWARALGCGASGMALAIGGEMPDRW